MNCPICNGSDAVIRYSQIGEARRTGRATIDCNGHNFCRLVTPQEIMESEEIHAREPAFKKGECVKLANHEALFFVHEVKGPRCVVLETQLRNRRFTCYDRLFQLNERGERIRYTPAPAPASAPTRMAQVYDMES